MGYLNEYIPRIYSIVETLGEVGMSSVWKTRFQVEHFSPANKSVFCFKRGGNVGITTVLCCDR